MEASGRATIMDADEKSCRNGSKENKYVGITNINLFTKYFMLPRSERTKKKGGKQKKYEVIY